MLKEMFTEYGWGGLVAGIVICGVYAAWKIYKHQQATIKKLDDRYVHIVEVHAKEANERTELVAVALNNNTEIQRELVGALKERPCLRNGD
jgi:predicted negative regulator of RcsB-dependent stress response